MTSTSGIEYWEIANYPLENARIGEFNAVRLVRCAYGDRLTLANDFLTPGTAEFIYPYTSFTVALARGVKIKPLRGGQQSDAEPAESGNYVQAVLQVTFSTVGPALYNDTTLIDEDLVSGAKLYSTDAKGLHWGVGDDAKPLEPAEAPPLVVAKGTYYLRYPRTTVIPDTVLTHPQKVNANAVTAYFLGLTFSAETLLYIGATIKHSVGTGGSRTYDIRHAFDYMAGDNGDGEGQHGWNWPWRPKTHKFEQVFEGPDDTPVPYYQTADFNF